MGAEKSTKEVMPIAKAEALMKADKISKFTVEGGKAVVDSLDKMDD